MNSIKNAIVTVTLLAVGYGSYIVLSEPQPGVQQDVSAMNIVGPDGTEQTVPNLDIEDSSGTPPVVLPALEPPQKIGDSLIPESSNNNFLDPPVDLPRTPTLDPPRVEASVPPESVIPTPATVEGDFSAAVPNSPAQPSFPALIPLPEMATEPGGLELQPPVDSSRREPLGDPEQPPEPNTPVEPGVDVPLLTPPSTGDVSAPQPNELTEVGVQPPVGVQESSQETAGLQSSSTQGALTSSFDKSSTPLRAPDEIDAQPDEMQPAPSPVMPPIDPSVGPIPPAPSEGSIGFETTWGDVQDFIRVKDLPKALQALSPWATDATLNQEQRQRCFRMLDELAGAVIYSRTSYLEPAYVVRAGETLEEIATAHGVPLELLAKINGISAPYALSTGESLKVVRGPFRAIVSVSAKQLTLFAGTYYAGRFRIEVGPDLPTEEAYYEVGEKSLGRSYFDRRTSAEVLRGSENNRYGEHWIGLRGEHITTGHSVGIHGRAKEKAPNDLGCISLDAIDADDLYSILSVGSQVHVRP